jgi:hypothetical protein
MGGGAFDPLKFRGSLAVKCETGQNNSRRSGENFIEWLKQAAHGRRAEGRLNHELWLFFG